MVTQLAIVSKYLLSFYVFYNFMSCHIWLKKEGKIELFMTMISSTNFWCNRAIDFLTAYSFQYEHEMQVLISPSNITQILYEQSYEVKWQRRILMLRM